MHTPQNIQRAGLIAGALIAVLTMAGCGSEPAAGPAPTTTRTTTTTTTTTTTSSTTPTAPAAAADGVDYPVCATRSCEVAVSGPVEIRFGGSMPGTMSITNVVQDSVEFVVDLDNGGGANGTLKPGCTSLSVGGSGGFGSFGGPTSECVQPPAAQPGAVTLQLPAMTGGTAILRIVTG